MIFSLEFARKTALAYNVICKPLCRELGVTQTAFDILMFLANNPDHKTARDIVESFRPLPIMVSAFSVQYNSIFRRSPFTGFRTR